jgi:hypothetical protein
MNVASDRGLRCSSGVFCGKRHPGKITAKTANTCPFGFDRRVLAVLAVLFLGYHPENIHDARPAADGQGSRRRWVHPRHPSLDRRAA